MANKDIKNVTRLIEDTSVEAGNLIKNGGGGGSTENNNLITLGKLGKYMKEHNLHHFNVDGLIALLHKYNVPNYDASEILSWRPYVVLGEWYTGAGEVSQAITSTGYDECGGGYELILSFNGEIHVHGSSPTLYELLGECKEEIEERVTFDSIIDMYMSSEAIALPRVYTNAELEYNECSSGYEVEMTNFEYFTFEDYITLFKE